MPFNADQKNTERLARGTRHLSHSQKKKKKNQVEKYQTDLDAGRQTQSLSTKDVADYKVDNYYYN